MNWMKFRRVYFLISGAVIAVGVYSLLTWGLNLGVDFKGGALIEYKIEKEISTEGATAKIEEKGIAVTSVQKLGGETYLFRLESVDNEKRESIKGVLQEVGGSVEELRFENVGPSIGPELIKKTIYALVIAAIAILIWITIQFKSFKFGVSAVLAMFHDSLVLLGVYGLFGHFLGAEVDFLFVTAMLTILSFSVHDTIVVYDRIRESQKKLGGNLYDLANKAITETMVRSLNNSFTIIFMLVALTLMGGSTLRWFSLSLLIGTISGTYSSPFVAVPILVTWDDIKRKISK